MRRAILFLLLLTTALALLAIVAHSALARITNTWFASDLSLRSRLAVASARQGLSSQWQTDSPRLKETLSDITRDERIMAAAACSMNGELLASTEAYPAAFSCRSIIERMQAEGTLHVPDTWTMTTELPSGPIHLGATLLAGPTSPLGVVILVHDLSYVQHREQTTRSALIIAFFIMALCASLITVIAARLARKNWLLEMRRALTGEAGSEFQPLVRDVRELAERLASERDQEASAGRWSAARLRATLAQHLHGERVTILANREPYIHNHGPDGIRVIHPASGLVTALEPVMRAFSGVWVAHGSGTADKETVDAHDRVRVPPGEESYQVRRVWLSDQEEDGYYYGFSNEGLWPLCHVAHNRPVFRQEDYQHYVQVNQKFADAVCEEVDSDDPIVLVQDYHFALAPKMIRERLPRATIITFWHIPWPNAQRIGICPWREELIDGLLGSSILGFHTQYHCNNFIDSVDAFMETRIDRESNAIIQRQRRTLVRPYPISIEWPVRWLEHTPSIEQARSEIRKELGLRSDTLLGVGIDRLDYTKGIEERLSAVDVLLTHHPELRGRFVFVQLAAPSRTKIMHYRMLNERIETLAASINEKWQTDTYRPIVLLREHHEPAAVFRYYRAAELCYVSSLDDGMNLVAKEFVAARDDEQGVLLLSQFTGAAREMTEALIVNPYDLQQASEAMAVALSMPAAEQRERMRSMRRLVSEFNVYRWAGRMLVDAAELRRKERIVGNLSGLFKQARPS